MTEGVCIQWPICEGHNQPLPTPSFFLTDPPPPLLFLDLLAHVLPVNIILSPQWHRLVEKRSHFQVDLLVLCNRKSAVSLQAKYCATLFALRYVLDLSIRQKLCVGMSGSLASELASWSHRNPSSLAGAGRACCAHAQIRKIDSRHLGNFLRCRTSVHQKKLHQNNGTPHFIFEWIQEWLGTNLNNLVEPLISGPRYSTAQHWQKSCKIFTLAIAWAKVGLAALPPTLGAA